MSGGGNPPRRHEPDRDGARELDIPTCTRVDEGVGTIAYTTTNYDTSTARAVTPMVYGRYGAPHATNPPNAATHAGRVEIGRQPILLRPPYSEE